MSIWAFFHLTVFFSYLVYPFTFNLGETWISFHTVVLVMLLPCISKEIVAYVISFILQAICLQLLD